MKRHHLITALSLLLALLFCLCACGEAALSVIGAHYDAEGNLILEMSDGSTVNAAQYSPDLNPQGLAFYPLPDGTYGVTAGEAIHLKEIHIPPDYRGRPVTRILERGFSDCAMLVLTLPETITVIETGAFSSCTHLISVTIPASVTAIEKNAFSGCAKLIEVQNLSALKIDKRHNNPGSIADNAQNIYTATEGEKRTFRTATDGYVFYDDGFNRFLMGYLGIETALTLPADCNGHPYSIYRYAFYGQSTLTHVTVPDTVKSLGRSAFQGCRGLTHVSLPDDISFTDGYVFADCTSLADLNLPLKATNLDSSTLRNCSALIEVEGDATYAAGWLLSVSLLGEGETVTLREGTVGIGSYAISNKWHMTRLVLPSSLVTIGDHAFDSCRGLTEVVIPTSVRYVGTDVFSNCSALTAVYFAGDRSRADLWKYTNFHETTLYYYSETAPTESGHYWHYVSGVPTPW